MHWIYLIHEFHNLSWITEINEEMHLLLLVGCHFTSVIYRCILISVVFCKNTLGITHFCTTTLMLAAPLGSIINPVGFVLLLHETSSVTKGLWLLHFFAHRDNLHTCIYFEAWIQENKKKTNKAFIFYFIGYKWTTLWSQDFNVSTIKLQTTLSVFVSKTFSLKVWAGIVWKNVIKNAAIKVN